MNRTTNLKKKKKCTVSPKPKLDSTKIATPSPRNPLKDLNLTTKIRSNTSTFTSNTSNSCSSISIAAQRGCLGFFISKNASKPYHKTPKSVPISKIRSKPPISHTVQPPLFLNKSQNAKVSIFSEFERSPHPKYETVGSEPLQWPFARLNIDDDSLTPMVNKVGCGESSGLDEKEVTPPVQSSISPEIQCGSSFGSSMSACYGAGYHLLSGVSDKRKCRPRGILAVEQEKDLGLFKDGSFEGFSDSSRFSLIPAPIEASMHWLPPMWEEENDQKESPQHGSTPCPSPSSSSSYRHGFSSGISGNSDSTSNTPSATRKNACLGTPSARLDFEGMSNGKRGHQYESPGIQISPSSGGDSLGSYNVVSTPRSDSSLDELSWFKNTKGCMFELDSMSNVQSSLTPVLSANNRASMRDPADALPLPGFSFQFTHPSRPSFDFIDQVQLEKISNDWRLGISSANWENSLRSQMRVSWRDGLVSRIFEMDDLDCCRLSSEDEDDTSCKVDEIVIQDSILMDNVTPNGLLSEQHETDEQFNVKVLTQPSSCAESISTEGAELNTSSDSDWNVCYKNQLFQE